MNDEIKMFIAGEEVVSQNEFTINEEMLSASSTILNNCYPKSWELTKDYVSNFYYPKDYSRFVLAQGEYEHGNQEFQPLEITGKNLLNVEAKNVSSILWSNLIINNGIMTLNGAPTTSGGTNLYFNSFQVNKSGTYRFSSNMENVPTGSYSYMILQKSTDNSTWSTLYEMRSDNTNQSVNVSLSTSEYYRLRFYATSTTNYNNTIYKPQLEEGNVQTSFEPYNQPNLSYETNVEKEWNSFNVYGNTYQETRSGINLLKIIATTTTDYGITFTVNDDKSITINGTNTKNSTVWLRLGNDITLASGTYTLSNGNPNVHYNTFLFYDDSGNIPANGNVVSKTFSSSVIVKPYIRIGANQTINNQTIYPMIVKGEYTAQTMPPYEQYGVMPSPDYPSELVSVGYDNLLGIPNVNYSGYGLTIKSANGVITISGTTTDTLLYDFNLISPISSSLGTLTKSLSPSGTYNGIQTSLRDNATYSVGLWSTNASNTTGTISANAYKFRIQINSGISVNATLKPQLEKGNIAHSYIPYGKCGVEITNCGKNLFDETQLLEATNWVKNSDGYYQGTLGDLYARFKSSNGGFKFPMQFKENTQYTISLVGYTNTGAGNGRFEINYTDGTTQNASNWNYLSPTNIITTTQENKTIKNISFTYGSNATAYIKDIQIEKGTTASDFEPYKSNTQLYVLDEPLRQLGTYKDKLYTDGRVLYVERNIAEKTLEGADHNGGGTTGTNAYFLETNVVCLNNNNIIVGMSNMFAPISFTNRANGLDVIYGQNGKVVLRTANNTSINWSNGTNRYNWLEANNPKINYVLQTPTITPLGYIDLPSSYEGQNNVSIYTGLDTRTELWYYWKNYDVLFAGVVKNSGDISLNPRHPHYCSLQILDYKTFLSESNTLDFVIANKTIREAIEMVVNAVSGYGFVVGNIDIDSANDIIGAYSTLNKTAYDVLQYLAEISGSRWRARVIDSLTMAIDFYDPDTLPEADDIEYTKEYWETNNIVDMTFNYGSRDYRNKQILLSNEVYGNINYEETLISNGYGDTFTVQNNIGVLLNVIVDGAEKTIATINDKQMGIDADFYYTPGKNIIESNGVYSAGTMIRATYQPLVKGRQIVYNASEVERISNQTQTEGVIARYENRNDILSSEELQKIAQTYIDYKGKAEVIIKITTQDNDLYDIGEVVYFNAPIDDLKQNYMVKAKNIEYIIIDKIIHLFYVYELTSSFNSEKAINYFDNQRNKASGNIAEGESITRNIDIETEVGILWTDGTVSSTTITVDGDNVLNSVLNSPFVE